MRNRARAPAFRVLPHPNSPIPARPPIVAPLSLYVPHSEKFARPSTSRLHMFALCCKGADRHISEIAIGPRPFLTIHLLFFLKFHSYPRMVAIRVSPFARAPYFTYEILQPAAQKQRVARYDAIRSVFAQIVDRAPIFGSRVVRYAPCPHRSCKVRPPSCATSAEKQCE